MDEQLYEAYLQEMHSLESFRMMYAAMHPSVPLERDDPDVKRLIEAMAFFSARTRLAGVREVTRLNRRIFRQFFSFLLTPMPAMGILQARPTGQFAEGVELPGNSEIAVTASNGRVALFRTCRHLRILPLEITGVKTVLLPSSGFRLILQFSAPYPRNDEVGTLSLHLNHLNDYLASLRIHHALREHFTAGWVFFGEDLEDSSAGAACGVRFGPFPAGEDTQNDESPHPLETERLFFHYPQQELYVHVTVPQPPRNWRRFSIALDLDAGWPRTMLLNRDVFHLFTVPMLNLKRSMAQSIRCDGTVEAYPIRHGQPEYDFSLHSVLGVYEVRKDSMVPLRAGILSGESGTYEIEESSDEGGGRHSRLLLHLPEAFDTRRTIAVDGLWLQPWFSELVLQWRTVAPYRRQMMGVKWDILGDLRPHDENHFLKDMEGFMHLFTLANRTSLQRDDLLGLMSTLGSVQQGPFQKACQDLSDVKVEAAPHGGPGAGLLRHVYSLTFKSSDQSLDGLFEAFRDHIGKVLDAWIADAAVEVRVEPGQGRA
ncbi:MAG: type VI secretion system baseplate subunit TssF [Syntrophobacteraceae bacterium]|nr:type VI secretion system baseplate subunit TssF [Syntrophobacteraceae bacterium]